MPTWVTRHNSPKRVGSMITDTAPLYTNATGLDDGEWIDMAGVESCTYVINGITTGTVLFTGWNGSATPAATEHGEVILGHVGSGLLNGRTDDGVILFRRHQIFRFMKCRITSATTITLDVDLKRVRYSS